jgi:hypothetical protein
VHDDLRECYLDGVRVSERRPGSSPALFVRLICYLHDSLTIFTSVIVM